MTSTSEMAVVSKQTKEYIVFAIKAAYEKLLADMDSKVEAEHDRCLVELAGVVERIAGWDSEICSPVLSSWIPIYTAISASLLHQLYGKELRQFLSGVPHLPEDVASVLKAAERLDQYLLKRVTCQDGQVYDNYKQQMLPYQVEAISGKFIGQWINMQLDRISKRIEQTIRQEKWECKPSSFEHRHGNSIVEVCRIMEETVDQFFNLQLPMRVLQLNGLVSCLDNAVQAYTRGVVSQLVDIQDLIPPVPIVTRCEKESDRMAFARKMVPDHRRSTQINALTRQKLYVRLNSLKYAFFHLNVLEDSIREHLAQRRPQENVMAGRSSVDSDLKARHVTANRPMDVLSTAFDGTRKDVEAAIDRICEFTGIKIIFWDMNFTKRLYNYNVLQRWMRGVLQGLYLVLKEMHAFIVDPLRDKVVEWFLLASVKGLVRVLQHGGPLQVFSQGDATFVEEDLQLLKKIFTTGGDEIRCKFVEKAVAPLQQILRGMQ